ncbi:uncharacterized protein LOC132626163 isoform X2 [Lycium barbarum]|uniref:uncharacterized protein LOC132626163 isoform X2 n=1 Tax=Lycium barbarum TaxID=112863 RepID=UPI00293F03CD|nr:uncharacterized protein LOC132626163 isoform X2 [Lycium barbarum]
MNKVFHLSSDSNICVLSAISFPGNPQPLPFECTHGLLFFLPNPLQQVSDFSDDVYVKSNLHASFIYFVASFNTWSFQFCNGEESHDWNKVHLEDMTIKLISARMS